MNLGGLLVPIAATTLVALCLARGTAQEDLVLHYTFDEIDNGIVADLSGSGNEGRVVGAVQAPSPRGNALRFDGVGDYVDCGNDPSLNLEGDLTIAVWFNASDVSGRNRILLGDAAGLTVNRNYSLRIDRGRLRIEQGNGLSGQSILSQYDVPTDEWLHVAVIWEFPEYFLYVNGERTERGELGFPITPTRGASRRIGGWFAGHFKGDIEEVRLYNRSLSEREVRAQFDPDAPEPAPTTDLTTRLRYSRGQALWRLRHIGPAPEGAHVRFRLHAPDAPEALVTGQAPLNETRPGSERWAAEVQVDTSDLTPDSYDLQAVVLGPDGTQVATARADFAYPQRPAWLGSQVGISDEVPSPFTPVQVRAHEGRPAVSVWGRTYEFGDTPFALGVESAGEQMLASPVRLHGRTADGDIAWAGAPPQVTEHEPSRCRLTQSLDGGALALELDATVEYDGLLKTSWQLRAAEATRLEALSLEIPLKPEHARYLHVWPKVRSGELREDWSGDFRPIIWLGDEERGLQWLCESDEHWRMEDPDRAVEIIRAEGEVTLRLNLVDHATDLQAGETLEYTFGLIATPLKPIEQDAWDQRIVRNPWYGWELDLPEQEVEGRPALEHYRDMGARVMMIWRWWDAFAYPLPIGKEAEFRRLVEHCHAHDLKVLPYVGGFLLSDRAPEAEFFKEEMQVVPSEPYALVMPGLEFQHATIICQAGWWQDFIVDGIARLMDEYDVDGVYLDTTARPLLCSNELHGCGYVKPDGTRAGAYPVFAVRDLFQRIYSVVRERKPDGIVDLHVYDCMNAPALAHATTYWNGEQLRRGEAFKPDALPLDRFRTEFMGYNWGVPADVLYYVMGGYRQTCALAVLHDVPVRAENLANLEIQAALWDLRERFGVSDAVWLPYWRNGEQVTVGPEDCHVSLHVHPEGRVLAWVSNLSREAAEVVVTLNAVELGLTAPLTARDALTEEALALEGRQLRLSLPSQGWRVVWVRGR